MGGPTLRHFFPSEAGPRPRRVLGFVGCRNGAVSLSEWFEFGSACACDLVLLHGSFWLRCCGVPSRRCFKCATRVWPRPLLPRRRLARMLLDVVSLNLGPVLRTGLGLHKRLPQLVSLFWSSQVCLLVPPWVVMWRMLACPVQPGRSHAHSTRCPALNVAFLGLVCLVFVRG